MTLSDVYEQMIKPMSAADRLRLATLILNDIPPRAVADYREEWNEEDVADFTRATWEGAPSGEEK